MSRQSWFSGQKINLENCEHAEKLKKDLILSSMENNVIVNDLKELICEKNDSEHYYKNISRNRDCLETFIT